MMADDTRPTLERVTVLANERVAEGVGLMVLHAPRCAAAVQPGEFVHLRVATGSDAILRRPFSVYHAHGERIELLYQVLGKGTLLMAEKIAGDEMDLVGPLGHGWHVPEGVTHALLVAGGLGAAPLAMLAEKMAQRGIAVTVALGTPTAERLFGREDFERIARQVVVATDDGSAGEHGFVTVAAERLLSEQRFDLVCTCGPEAMERAIARLASAHRVRCQVSLERLMACGIGACLSCIVSTRDGLKRACVDGPVFDAEEVVWDASQTPPKH
ncbi:MAG: dihydroorotate dehydrogenase electron transfer subunit [Coriobacteriia bacterium]|nr:dihydroorotate dehydrogenase electron transfer subunit [Coriobacteriia bacterium]